MSYRSFIREQPVEASFGFGATFFTSSGQTFFISLFVPALVSELPLTEGQFGTVYGLGTLIGATLLPFIAANYDTTPLSAYTRRVLWGMGVAALIMAVTVHPIMLVLAVTGLRLTGPGLITHIAQTTMAKGFEKRRGVALGISSLGYAAGEALLPPLVALLLLWVPWQAIWICIAALYLLVLPRLAEELIRRARFESFVASDFVGQSSTTPTRGHLRRSFKTMAREPRFWWLLPAQMLLPMLMTAVFLYQAPIAASKDWSLSYMASLFTVFAVVRAAMTLVFGKRIDQVGALSLIPWVALPAAVSLVLLAWIATPAIGIVCFALIGLTFGAGSSVFTAMWAEIYGSEQLGAIKGMTGSLAVFSSAAGPVLAGVLLELGVGFPALLTGFAIALGLVSVSAAIGLRRPAAVAG